MKELKESTGTIDEAGLGTLCSEFGIDVPTEIEFPWSRKLTERHTLIVERRGTQRVTDSGLVNQLNWRIHENMVQPVKRINA